MGTAKVSKAKKPAKGAKKTATKKPKAKKAELLVVYESTTAPFGKWSALGFGRSRVV